MGHSNGTKFVECKRPHRSRMVVVRRTSLSIMSMAKFGRFIGVSTWEGHRSKSISLMEDFNAQGSYFLYGRVRGWANQNYCFLVLFQPAATPFSI